MARSLAIVTPLALDDPRELHQLAEVAGPGNRCDEALVPRGRHPTERECVGEVLDQLVALLVDRHRSHQPSSPSQVRLDDVARVAVLAAAAPGPSRWTGARTVRQAADMLCVLRSSLLVLAVTSWGVASADPKPAAAAPAAAPVPAAATPGVKTIIVIRHAEAEHQPGGDPSLTPDGRTRATELARVLGDTQLDAVYLTHFQRNRQTAAPLPRKAGEKPTVIDDVPGTLAALRSGPWGATALVIGHSNTVPDLVRGLTGSALPADEPIIYDRMWIVTLARDGTASLLRLHYGAPVAVPATPVPVTR
jgi:phosphohistidine phosphatase SixA